MTLKSRFRQFLSKGHERTIKAKKNILFALIFKGGGVIIGFAYFPLSLNYLDPVRFGIFLTLASMVDWFSELDVGIGNGLRNCLGEALAVGDDEKGRGYVSTAYFFIGTIFSVASLIILSISYFLPWAEWLEADPALNSEIAILAMFMFGAFAIRFVASMVYQVFFALQRTAMVNLFTFLGKLAFLFMIFYLLYFTEKGSLVNYGIIKTLTFAIVPVLVGLYYFNRELKPYRPSFKYVKKAYFKDLFSLGLQFFIIKISMVIIFTTNNFLIARFASLEEVPQYEAAYKYLSIFLMLFVILGDQMWAANLEAFRKGELEWMRKMLKALRKVWLVTIVLSALMILISPFVFTFWLQNKIEIPLFLTIMVGVSILTTNWVNMHNLVLNGTGKIKLQMWTWLFSCILNIPMSILFAVTFNLGTIGIVLGTITSLLPMVFISPIQVHKIMTQSDTGIWAK